jgi:hypothetical protein
MTDEITSDSLYKQRSSSFYSFLSDNYEQSKFFLPKNQPANDMLNKDEMKKLLELIEEKDFYEINSIIRKRYSVK